MLLVLCPEWPEKWSQSIRFPKNSWGHTPRPHRIGVFMHAFCQANAWPYHFILACSGPVMIYLRSPMLLKYGWSVGKRKPHRWKQTFQRGLVEHHCRMHSVSESSILRVTTDVMTYQASYDVTTTCILTCC